MPLKNEDKQNVDDADDRERKIASARRPRHRGDRPGDFSRYSRPAQLKIQTFNLQVQGKDKKPLTGM